MASHSINISYHHVHILEKMGTVLSHIEDKIKLLEH